MNLGRAFTVPAIVVLLGSILPAASGTTLQVENEEREYGELWVSAPDGGEQHQLARAHSFDWAPNGSLAFARRETVYLGAPGQTTPSPLFELGSVGQIAWSPDGTSIAVLGRTTSCGEQCPSNDIYVFDLDGGRLANITATPEQNEFDIDWSPTGHRLVYSASDGSNVNIHTIDSSGADPRLIATSGSDPNWSPDGNQIAYSAAVGDQSDIFIVAAEGAEPRNLTDTSDRREYDPAWSPNGTHIAYVRFGGELHDGGIYVTDEVAGPPRQVARPGDDQWWWFGIDSPVWSPDGSRLAFTVWYFESGTNVFVVSSDGTELTDITDACQSAGSPRWSPDGTQIGFVTSLLETDLKLRLRKHLVAKVKSYPFTPPYFPFPGCERPADLLIQRLTSRGWRTIKRATLEQWYFLDYSARLPDREGDYRAVLPRTESRVKAISPVRKHRH